VHIVILGTRGIPSRHGGFETFAQDLACFLVSRNHQATVYCQVEESGLVREDIWNGIRRVHIKAGKGPLGTIIFDWKAIRHSMREKDVVVLTLGYNTAILNVLYRLSSTPNIMNMDGIEWKRQRWTGPARAWFWFNEWCGARVANHLVADHPEIGRHISMHTGSKKISVIPYGADQVTSAPLSLIHNYDLKCKKYHLIIARPEPENYILEMVRAYSLRPRGIPLVVLGTYRRDRTEYQKAVLDAAGPEIRFLGPIFERPIVKALRFYARAYLHGHRVGGTNPSLVEALGAGNAVIAHNNRFNRWVAGEGGRYFESIEQLDQLLESLNADSEQLMEMEQASRKRFCESFTQDKILTAYEDLLAQFCPMPAEVVFAPAMRRA
jgi:glycosyltransferase involved in cell wall biosynthesis